MVPTGEGADGRARPSPMGLELSGSERSGAQWSDLSAEPPDLTADAINAVVRELYPGASGMCVEVGADYAVAACDLDPRMVRPGGFVSGPTQFAIVDAALWYVTFAALGRIEPMAMTSELSMRFLRPAQGSRIFSRARLEAVSRRSVVATAHVWCDDRTDKVTATAQGTYAIPLPR